MARQQFIDLARNLGAGLAYAPDGNDVAAGRLADVSLPPLHQGELKNGAALKRPGLVIDTAEATFDGVNDYVDSGWATRANLCVQPSPEGGAAAKWTSAGRFFNNASAVNKDTTTSQFDGTTCWRIECPGALNVEGFAIASNIPVTKGVTYTFSMYVKGATGNEEVKLNIGSTEVGQTVGPVTKIGKEWQRLSVTLTATENGTMQWAVTGPAALKAQTFYADCALVEASAETLAFFPLVAEVENGVSVFSGGAWETGSESGPFVKERTTTYCGMAQRSNSGTRDTLMGSSTATGSHSVMLSIEAESRDVRFWPDTEAASVTWAAAWPGTGAVVFWELVFREVANTVELFINGLSAGAKTMEGPFNAPGRLLIGARGIGGGGGEDPFVGAQLPFAVFGRELTAGERRLLVIAAGAAPPAFIPPPSQITVKVISEGGTGRGYDLTSEIENLIFSNSDPGGDETCTFTLHRSWFAANPEVGRGDILQVCGGVDVLWQGRIEENDRATGDSETIGVTAYGLGNRLGDVTYSEIYIDADMTKWGPPSLQRQVNLESANFAFVANLSTAFADTSTIGPGFLFGFAGITKPSTQNVGNEIWYHGGGTDIGRLLYDFIGDGTTTWSEFGVVSASDVALAGEFDQSANYNGTSAGNQTLTASTTGRKYAAFLCYYTGSFTTGPMTNRHSFNNVKVEGLHGLARQGTWPIVGFTADQIALDSVARASGVQARIVTPFPYVIPNFVVTAAAPRTVLEEASQYANVNYGTWGPESPFDHSTVGYFDYTEIDGTEQDWFATRSDFEADLSFHSETSTLYDTVDVTYTNEAGKQITERSSIYSADLQAAGLSPRVYSLDAGTTTDEGAKLFARIFLNIFAGFAPARGSGTLTGTVRHREHGDVPVYYLRADGSNIRVPDILPAEATFAFDSTPDRRTTFPIKRVTVDCSGDVPRATVEFDQNTDALSTLLAQQASQAALVNV